MLNMSDPIGCNFRVYPVQLNSFIINEYLISESIEVYDFENYREYDPFIEYYNSSNDIYSEKLYLRFISLNRNSQEILKFVQEFGFPNMPNTSLINNEEEEVISNADINDIYFQSCRMRFFSDIARREKDTTVDELYQLIINAFMSFSDDNFSIGRDLVDKKYLLEGSFLLSNATYEIKAHYAYIKKTEYQGKCDIAFFKEQFKDIFGEDIVLLNQIADRILITAINKEIRDVYTYLSMPSPGMHEYPTKTKAPTLISALYAMLYFDIIQNKVITKCANPKCNTYYDVSSSRSDRIYCTIRCAQSCASKNYRKVLKERKEEIRRLEELKCLELFQTDSQ